MKHLPLAVVIVFLATSGFLIWQKETEKPPHVPQHLSYIDLATIEVGDSVGDFEVTKVEAYEARAKFSREERNPNIKITFKGSATLEGKLINPEGEIVTGPMLEITQSSTHLPSRDPKWNTNGICISNSEVKDPGVSFGDTVQVLLEEYVVASYPAGGCAQNKVVSIKKL